ncbi:MAG TPA: ribonuclease Y [Urbifossiella sp.]|nr:ribonuclease Y [Urbifossiella sp.]
METLEVVGIAVGALVVGAGGAYAAVRLGRSPTAGSAIDSSRAQDEIRQAEARGQELVEKSRRDAEQIVREAELRARDEAFRRREEANRELETQRNEVRELERRVEKREDAAEQRHKELARKERHQDAIQKKLSERKELLEKKSTQLEELITEETKKLHDITGLSRDDAQRMLLEKIERELAEELAARIRQHEDRIKQTAEAKAREILATSIQRYASEHTASSTVSTVDIPSDDMKGRIIGREGRNIRTFEKCTGVDVIVDDTPGVVIVSAFDNIRRETARLALTKLILDGRIHPTRIEEVVAETQQEMERHIMELGKTAVLDADVPMPHEKIVHLLGRLRFRTSYSQNVLQHSVEVAHLCGLMASELGLQPQLARRCGLLHDVGKAADHEMEGGHPKIGAELARRYGETSKEVLHAIAGHHDDVTVDNIYTVLVSAADAISASRPGARRETLEKYVKRLELLEAVACGFPGVEQAFAIQAGRELRVIANSSRTSDADAVKICRDIARAIEQQLDYPGEIKVTVIRESRSVEVAK